MDVFEAMDGDSSLLGDDGLHPSAEGYRVMAEEFLEVIISRYETIDGLTAPVPTALTGP